MKRRILSTGFIALSLCTAVSAQTLSGRLTTSFYTFERNDTPELSATQARGFQMFSLDFNSKNILFRAFGQSDTDFKTQLAGDGKVRMYNLYLQFKNIAKRAEIKLGRQPIFSGVAVGTIDGAQVKIDATNWLRIKGFAGSLMPANQRLKLVDDLDQNYMAGGQINFYPSSDINIGVSYFNKNQQRASYNALRADSIGNVFTQFIEPDNQAFQFASLDASWNMSPTTNLYARGDYDLSGEQMTRAEFSARTELTSKLSMNGSYTFRSPRLPRNSIFWVFNIENNHEIEGGVYYRYTPSFGIFGNVAGIFYEEPATVRTALDPKVQNKSLRATVGLDFGYGNLSYVRRGGYAGTLDGLNGSAYYPFLQGKFLPNLQLSWASYTTDSETVEKQSLFSGAAGVLLKPHKLLSLDGQLQFLHNRFYSNDMRFLFRLQYWFFARL